MKIIDLYKHLSNKYNIENQEVWDKSGIVLNSNFNCDVRNPVISLDLNMDVFNFALSKESNLIISHHPLYIDENDLKKREIKKLIEFSQKRKISYISLHTCFDKSENGMNKQILKILGCKNIERSIKSEYIWFGKINSSIFDFINLLKNKLNLNYAICNVTNQNIHTKKNLKIGVLGGSGSSELECILKKEKCNVYVTSEIKWHIWNNFCSNRNDIFLIDVPHSIEKIFIDIIAKEIYKLNAIKYEPIKLSVF